MATETRYIDDRPPTLEEAQAFVEGDVELIQLYDGRQILVNEEGLIRNLQHNPAATQALYEGGKFAGRYIVGNAIILAGSARWLPEET